MTSPTAAQSVLLTPQPLQWLKGCGFFLFSIAMFATLDALAKGLVHVYSAPLVNFVDERGWRTGSVRVDLCV